ncbi:hypothetical protein, partial [Rhizobium sp. RU36D]|uniref:hypothetical protein n=1 Tax=Rhizobium sp. RU36D TaxID=1907415 RepID=UPI001AED0365
MAYALPGAIGAWSFCRGAGDVAWLISPLEGPLHKAEFLGFWFLQTAVLWPGCCFAGHLGC